MWHLLRWCRVYPGAGQDVGKSCVVVRIGSKTFMFDCGMHLGYQDERRWGAVLCRVQHKFADDLMSVPSVLFVDALVEST
jgi:predicted metal-dependent RNase